MTGAQTFYSYRSWNSNGLGGGSSLHGMGCARDANAFADN